MKRVIATFTTIFILAMASAIAYAGAVPGAVLFLDASDNADHPKAWKNLGEAGGSLPAANTAPKLEEGPIKIARLGINERKAMYYTAKASLQTFGGPVHKNPKLYLADWTFEFLCKRNGNLFVEEHHFAGFQNSPREGAQGIRFWLLRRRAGARHLDPRQGLQASPRSDQDSVGARCVDVGHACRREQKVDCGVSRR